MKVEEFLAALPPEPARHDRPYVIVNFIASVDGRPTFQGRSGKLGDAGDRAMFNGLREQVDAVLAGTGTIRIERYGRILVSPERRRRRSARGLAPEPLACIVTRTGELPLDLPLFGEPDARVVIFTAVDLDIEGVAAHTEVVRLDGGEAMLSVVLRHLRADFGVRTLLCEGGPIIFSSLLQERLVDELFLTLAPKLTGGGSSSPITVGPELTCLMGLELRSLLEREGSLYLRYAVA